MPREVNVPAQTIDAKVVTSFKRNLGVAWRRLNDDDPESLLSVGFDVEDDDGVTTRFEARDALLDMPLESLGGATIRQYFDGLGDALLAVQDYQQFTKGDI